jgi:hypothetical protein
MARSVIVLIALCFMLGCASEPLTAEEEAVRVEEQEERAYEEQDRKILYVAWEKRCLATEGVVMAFNPWRPCLNRRNCIPSKVDWSYNLDKDRPDYGNAVVCLSRADAEEMMRSIFH